MDIRKIIGNNVLNARKIRNLSQEQFAEMIGIEPSALSKIENGKSYPSQQTLENIICALKIKPDVLFKTEEKIDIEKYLDEQERTTLMLLLGKLCENINDAKMQKWNSDKSIKLTNWSIDKIKAIADKCSDTISKPSSVGFYDFAMGRFKLFENVM